MQKRKLLGAALTGALTVSMLMGGCGTTAGEVQADAGSESPAQTKEQTLTLWMPPFGTEESLDKEVWGKILEPFEQEHNVEVSIEIVPWSNYEEKYLTGISSGQGPDVGYMYMEMINDYIESESIERELLLSRQGCDQWKAIRDADRCRKRESDVLQPGDPRRGGRD